MSLGRSLRPATDHDRRAPRRLRGARRAARAAGAAACVLLLPLTACGTGEGGGARFLSIGTGGTGGIYYPVGGAIAARLSAGDSLRRFTAEVTGGSVENVHRVAAGQIDLGFTLAVSAYEAFHGGPDFDRAVSDLRIVAPLWPNLTHVLVRRAAGIASVADLEGRRVSVGAAGSGTEQVARQVLEANGLGYDDVEERFLTFSESASALRDGAIDAAIMSVGFPAAAVLEATTSGDVALLPVEAAPAAALAERHPYYRTGTIPPGVYPGVDAPVPTVAMNNWMVALESLDGEVVQALLDLLSDGRDALAAVHEMAARVDPADLAAAPIPLHPAAASWLDRR